MNTGRLCITIDHAMSKTLTSRSLTLKELCGADFLYIPMPRYRESPSPLMWAVND